MRTKEILSLLVGIMLVFFGFSGKTLAQEVRGVSVSPLTFELTANPGDIVTNKLRVYNSSTSAIGIKIEVEDFRPVGESGQVVVAPDEDVTYSLKKWVSAEPSEFILEPAEQKFIDFTISVPQNAEPGGKYGTILASTSAVMSEEKVGGSAVAQKVGALVLLTVSGSVKENLIVKEFSVAPFSEYGPVDFVIRFENLGTLHVRPRGFVSITDWRGKKVADAEFSQLNIIPGTIRKSDVKWGSKWMIGKYTATLVGSYGTSNLPFDPPVTTFWIIPWKALSISLAALLIFAVFIFKSRRRLRLALRVLLKGGV